MLAVHCLSAHLQCAVPVIFFADKPASGFEDRISVEWKGQQYTHPGCPRERVVKQVCWRCLLRHYVNCFQFIDWRQQPCITWLMLCPCCSRKQASVTFSLSLLTVGQANKPTITPCRNITSFVEVISPHVWRHHINSRKIFWSSHSINNRNSTSQAFSTHTLIKYHLTIFFSLF